MAHFSDVGNKPCLRLTLASLQRGIAISSAASLMTVVGMLSGPGALDVFRSLSKRVTDAVLTCLNLNDFLLGLTFVVIEDVLKNCHVLLVRETILDCRLLPTLVKNKQKPVAILFLSVVVSPEMLNILLFVAELLVGNDFLLISRMT